MAGSTERPLRRMPDDGTGAAADPHLTGGVATVVAPLNRLWATGYREAAAGARPARVRRALMSPADLRGLVTGPERVVAWRLATGSVEPEPVVFPSGELQGSWFVAEDAGTALRLAMQAAVLDRGRCLASLTTEPGPDPARAGG